MLTAPHHAFQLYPASWAVLLPLEPVAEAASAMQVLAWDEQYGIMHQLPANVALELFEQRDGQLGCLLCHNRLGLDFFKHSIDHFWLSLSYIWLRVLYC